MRVPGDHSVPLSSGRCRRAPAALAYAPPTSQQGTGRADLTPSGRLAATSSPSPLRRFDPFRPSPGAAGEGGRQRRLRARLPQAPVFAVTPSRLRRVVCGARGVETACRRPRPPWPGAGGPLHDTGEDTHSPPLTPPRTARDQYTRGWTECWTRSVRARSGGGAVARCRSPSLAVVHCRESQRPRP